MAIETVRPLDPETLDLFARKGTEVGADIPHVGNANGVKVRRVMQITSDLAKAPFDQLRILDLACGEGVYAIEAALRGATVVAVDGRTDRMDGGARAAGRLGLSNLRFEQHDIRQVNVRSHGRFDAIFFLGILYHLDGKDVFPVLRNLYEMCEHFVVIDTHIALEPQESVEHDGHMYQGMKVREHGDVDPEALRKARLLASLDNTWSFLFTRESLVRVIRETGFSSVYVCEAPLEPWKPENRVTLVATKGTPVQVSSYPWVNGKSESQIEILLKPRQQPAQLQVGSQPSGLRHLAKSAINGILGPLGFEIRRIE